MSVSPSPETVIDLRQRHYNATLEKVKRIHSDLRVIRVRPDFAFPTHKAGQYTTLGLGNWEARVEGCAPEIHKPEAGPHVIRRAYSISHPILNDQGQLTTDDPNAVIEFYVVLVRTFEKPSDPGAPALTPRLFKLEEGDRLYMGEKVTGHYTLDPVRGDEDVILLSTGTGEAPHNYKVWELLRKGHKGKILAACCARYRQDLGYLPVHEKVVTMFPNYTYIPLTTRDTAAGQKMYIQDLITSGELERRLGKKLDPASMHVFLCGNPAMIGVPRVNKETGQHEYPKPTGVVEILEQRGFQCDEPRKHGNIHFEKYW